MLVTDNRPKKSVELNLNKGFRLYGIDHSKCYAVSTNESCLHIFGHHDVSPKKNINLGKPVHWTGQRRNEIWNISASGKVPLSVAWKKSLNIVSPGPGCMPRPGFGYQLHSAQRKIWGFASVVRFRLQDNEGRSHFSWVTHRSPDKRLKSRTTAGTAATNRSTCASIRVQRMAC